MKNIIFVNVDTQKDFMNKDGKLYVKGAEKIKPNLAILSEFGRINNIVRVNTADYHVKGDEELSDNPDYFTTFPEHCMAKTDGAENISETKTDYSLEFPCDTRQYLPQHGKLSYVISYNTITIFKDKFDVFLGNRFTEEIFRLLEPEVVVIYGVATDVCVRGVVQGIMKMGWDKVVVVKDAIKGISNEIVRILVGEWKDAGVVFLTTAELTRQINHDII